MEKVLKHFDKDHIHYMVETGPIMFASKIVKLVKSYTTYHIWKRYPDYLKKHFGKDIPFGQTDIPPVVLGMFQRK